MQKLLSVFLIFITSLQISNGVKIIMTDPDAALRAAKKLRISTNLCNSLGKVQERSPLIWSHEIPHEPPNILRNLERNEESQRRDIRQIEIIERPKIPGEISKMIMLREFKHKISEGIDNELSKIKLSDPLMTYDVYLKGLTCILKATLTLRIFETLWGEINDDDRHTVATEQKNIIFAAFEGLGFNHNHFIESENPTMSAEELRSLQFIRGFIQLMISCKEQSGPEFLRDFRNLISK